MSGERTIIFDFDGTLVDSFWPGFRIVNAIAPEYGFRTVTEAEVPLCRDMSSKELMKYMGVPIYRLPMIIRRVRADIRREIPDIKIVAGIENCLQALKDAGNRLGIVTSNDRKNVETCLINNKIMIFFDFIHTSINLFGKHLTLAWVMKRKGIDKSRAVYVGDENRDIEAAQKCHIPGIAVGWGFQSKKKLISTKPSFFAATPMDIVEYISGLG